MSATPPCKFGSFTSLQMVHTHTPTHTHPHPHPHPHARARHLAQSGQTLEGQGKRKSGRMTGQTPTRGGADRSAWHNLQGESQTYLATRRTQTWPNNTGAHMRKRTHGDLVNDKWCTHKYAQDSWKGSRPSVFNSTLSMAVSSQKRIECTAEPHQINQKEVTTPGRHVLCLSSHVAWLKCQRSVSRASLRKGKLAQLQSTGGNQSQWKNEAIHSGKLFQHKSIDGWNSERRPTVSLYLDELLGWKL